MRSSCLWIHVLVGGEHEFHYPSQTPSGGTPEGPIGCRKKEHRPDPRQYSLRRQRSGTLSLRNRPGSRHQDHRSD